MLKHCIGAFNTSFYIKSIKNNDVVKIKLYALYPIFKELKVNKNGTFYLKILFIH